MAEPIHVYHARLRGEAAFLAGESCNEIVLLRYCAAQLDAARRCPARGWDIPGAFKAGYEAMGECLSDNGFALEDMTPWN